MKMSISKSGPALRYTGLAILVVCVALAIARWVNHLLEWPSEGEVHQKLLAITDGQAAQYAMFSVLTKWGSGKTNDQSVPLAKRFSDVFEPPCLFGREEIRSKEKFLTSRYWAFVSFRRSGISAQSEPYSAIVVLVPADVLGFEKLDPYFLLSRNFRQELLNNSSFAKLTHVSDCQSAETENRDRHQSPKPESPKRS